MYKKLLIALVLCLTAFNTASAEENGYIYKSDIRTYIDGMEITSYNIGGKTVVKAIDLRPYGFDVEWDEESRSVNITGTELPSLTPAKSAYNFEGMYDGSDGIMGEIKTTDINVYFYDHKLTAYNTGGNMMVCVEEMAQTVEGDHDVNYNTGLSRSDLGYDLNYDDSAKRLDLYSMRKGVTAETPYGTGTVVNTIDRFYDFHGYYRNEIFTEDTYVNYDEIGTAEPLFSCNELFKEAGIEYNVQDGKLYLSIPDSFKAVKPQRWNAVNYTDSGSVMPVFKIKAYVNNIEYDIKILLKNDSLFIDGKDLEKMNILKEIN